MMVAAEEVVGPGGGLVQGPVPGRCVPFSKGFLFAIGFKPVISADVDALPFPRKDLAPPFNGTSALPIKEIFGTLGVGAQESDFEKRTVPAAAAAGGDKLNPVLQFRDRALEPGAIDFLKEPSHWFKKRGFWSEGQVMKKSHHGKTRALSGFTLSRCERVRIEACLWFFFKKIKTILLRKRKFQNKIFPVWMELF